MTNTDDFASHELAQIHTIKVISTKTNTTIYTFKVAQTSPERALAFVTDQLGLVGSKKPGSLEAASYKVCVGKATAVYMPKGG